MSSKYKCYSKEGEDWTALEILEGNRKKAAETITRQKEKPAENSCAGLGGRRGDKGILKWKEFPICYTMRPRGQWCGPILGDSLLLKRFCLEMSKSLDLCIHLFTGTCNTCLVCTELERFTISFLKCDGTCFSHEKAVYVLPMVN